MISKEKIEEVRERSSIVEVIGDYVPLTKRGTNYLGLCPFHSEKTPSFTVSDVKSMFYCFGCHAGGNVITFLMKHENIEFKDAVLRLAKRYGIRIDEVKREEPSGLNEKLVAVSKAALTYFLHSLETKPEGAIEYLGKRGFTGEILDRFRVGYAPSGWDGLSSFLKKKNIDIELALKAGLLSKKDDRVYDRFRSRIMFPITDSSGKVIAFGGRSIDGGEPKYLNSPESPIFKKAATLYAMYQAKKEAQAKGYMFVVEGYFDLLAMHKFGFTNTVATMGTALTQEHLRKLKPYAADVYTLFDSDEAGKKAALRSLDIAFESEARLSVILLKGAKDPDEFLQKYGSEGLNEAVKGAVPIIEFFLNTISLKYDTDTAKGKALYLDEALPVLAKIKNEAEKGHYVLQAANVLKIDTSRIYAALDSTAVQKRGGVREGDGAIKAATVATVDAKATKLFEEMILKIVITHPNLYGDEVSAALTHFLDPMNLAIGQAVKNAIESGALDASGIVDMITDESMRNYIAAAAFDDGKGYLSDPEKMLEDSIVKLLGAGRPKPATMKLIKMLEEGGHADVAEKMVERLSRGDE